MPRHVLDNPTGEAFELDGKWFVIVDRGRKDGRQSQQIHPQPTEDVDEAYIHPDGMTHICANPRCPNLAPRSKNSGVPRKYCSMICKDLMSTRTYNARHGKGRTLQYDPLNRLFAIRLPRSSVLRNARERLEEHQTGSNGEHCPEANEHSSFQCPGAWNPRSVSEYKWFNGHRSGPWPGACLLYATLLDHVIITRAEFAGIKAEREFTAARGEWWRWKDEVARLPLPEGVVRA